jgi:hypothetical protein
MATASPKFDSHFDSQADGTSWTDVNAPARNPLRVPEKLTAPIPEILAGLRKEVRRHEAEGSGNEGIDARRLLVA